MRSHNRAQVLAAIALTTALAGCATSPRTPAVTTTPKFPDYPRLDVPAALRVGAEIRERHDTAWQRLQSGDPRGASRDFNEILKRSPDFYPSETGQGYVHLSNRQFKQAVGRFAAAIAKNDRYLPAWIGLAEAQLGLGNEDEAIDALERILTIDPKRDGVKTRIELLKFKQVQMLIVAGQRARQAGRMEEAENALERALALSPSSTIILRELAAVEMARGAADAAEAHIRRAITNDADDAELYATLGSILEGKERYADAAAAYEKAATLGRNPAWRQQSEALREKAMAALIPAEFKELSSAASVNRGQLAALIGMRLQGLIERAPRRPAAVATDVRDHWAAAWILPVTQAGIMDIQPNHTFLPSANVRRIDLARIVTRLLNLLAGEPRVEVTKWKAARPRFADLPTTNLSYTAAALAVSSGAMSPQDGDRFQPAALATGADVIAAISRLEQLGGRK